MAIVDPYPDNSHTGRIEREKAQTTTPQKKVESVVQGETKLKKKGEIRKVADVFVSEDITNVKSYILMDVLVPAIKKAISDIVTNGIDMVLYGEAGRNRRRDGSVTRTSYQSYYEGASRGSERPYASVSRNVVDYDDVLFDSRADADAVLDQMIEIIQNFGQVSIGDLYDLAHVPTTNYTLNNYGWRELTGCRSERVREGYILKLPRPVSLK